MMERFGYALVRIGFAATIVLAVLLLGVGVLLLWKPALVLSILIYSVAGGCILVGAFILIAMLIGFIRR